MWVFWCSVLVAYIIHQSPSWAILTCCFSLIVIAHGTNYPTVQLRNHEVNVFNSVILPPWSLSKTLSFVHVFVVLRQWIVQIGMRADPFGQPLLYGLYGVALSCTLESDRKRCMKNEKGHLNLEVQTLCYFNTSVHLANCCVKCWVGLSDSCKYCSMQPPNFDVTKGFSDAVWVLWKLLLNFSFSSPLIKWKYKA